MRRLSKAAILTVPNPGQLQTTMRLRLRSIFKPAAALTAVTLLAVTPNIAAAQSQSRLTSTAGAYLAARAAAFRFDLDIAAQYYRVVFERNPTDTRLAATILSLWVEAGEIDDAAQIAEAVIAADPGYELARMVLASVAIKDDEFDVAELHLDAVAGDPFSVLVTGLIRGWLEVGLGDVDAALAALDERPGSDLLTAFHAALIADLDGRSEEALSRMGPIYEPDQSQRLSEAYARMLARAGMADDAEQVVVAFLEIVPDHPRLLALLEEIRAGSPIAPMVATAGEGVSEVFYGLASSLLSNEEFDIAINFLQLSRYLGAASDLPIVLLGQLFQSQRRDREAVRVFDSVSAGSPYGTLIAIAASVSDQRRGFAEEAIARLAPIVEADPGNVAAADALSGFYRSQSRWPDAERVLSGAIDAVESFSEADWTLFFGRGIAYERMGEWENAEADFRRALLLSTDEPEVLNYLGYSWLERGENYLEALEIIQLAVEQNPDSGHIIDSLGWAYYKLGNYTAAVATLEIAVELTPSQPDIHEHLGDAYWRAGRTLEAVFQWSHALIYDPEPDVSERIEDKITNGLPDVEEGVPIEGILEIN